MADYVFAMFRASKFYRHERQVLADISLSFLPGAKIGVLGANGAGKSTLLRIMAGLEEPSSGIAELAPGASVGLLPQEPELDPTKDVRGNVEDGVRPLRRLLDRFNEVSAAFAEPDADFDALLVRFAPAERPPGRWASAGSALVVAGWLLTSLLFGWWVRAFADFTSAVGSLTVFLVLNAYVFASATVLLAGVQLDELLRERSQR